MFRVQGIDRAVDEGEKAGLGGQLPLSLAGSSGGSRNPSEPKVLAPGWDVVRSYVCGLGPRCPVLACGFSASRLAGRESMQGVCWGNMGASRQGRGKVELGRSCGRAPGAG